MTLSCTVQPAISWDTFIAAQFRIPKFLIFLDYWYAKVWDMFPYFPYFLEAKVKKDEIILVWYDFVIYMQEH